MTDVRFVVASDVVIDQQQTGQTPSSATAAVSGRSLVARLLSPRDQAVLTTVKLFRQVSSDQLKRLHFQDLSPRSSEVVTARVLKRLTKWGELSRLGRAVGGWNGGSTGYIYVPAGSRARIPDPHTLDITELWTSLSECQRKWPIALQSFLPEPYCHEQIGTLELKPDARTHITTPSGEYLWFIEVDRGTEWRAALGKKMRAYVKAYERWPHKTFPRVLFTVPDEERRRFVESVARKQEVPLFEVVLFREAVRGMCR